MRRQRRVADRHVGCPESSNTTSAAPISATTASPRKRTLSVRQHRLVAQVREDRERVVRHVERRQHVDEAGPARAQRGEVAELERRVRMRRADHAHRQHARLAAGSGHASAPKRSLPSTLAGASRRAARAPTALPGRRHRRRRDRRRRRPPAPPRRSCDSRCSGTARRRARRAPRPRSAAGSRAAAPRRSSACRACRRRTARHRARRTPAAAATARHPQRRALRPSSPRGPRRRRARRCRRRPARRRAAPCRRRSRRRGSRPWCRSARGRRAARRRAGASGSATSSCGAPVDAQVHDLQRLRVARGHRDGSGRDRLAAGVGERAADQRRGRVEPVRGARRAGRRSASAARGRRLDPVGEVRIGRPADQPPLERRQALRPRRAAADRDGGVAHDAARRRHRRRPRPS